MAIGDAAIAAGMDNVPGSTEAKTIDTEIMKTRDYIAERTEDIVPVVKGGTGGTTAAQARSNLDVLASGVVTRRSGNNVITLYWNGSRVNINVDGFEVGTIPYTSDIGGGSYLPLSGGTVSGEIYLPNASPASSSYAVAYINGDGRISKNASSERYKDEITEIDPAQLGDIFPQLVSYVLKEDPTRTTRYGHIAESLDASDDQRPFVVYDLDGRPDSIDFIPLLMAQNAQLHQAVDLLAQRIAALEGTP